MKPKHTRRHAPWRQTVTALIVLVGLLLPALPARAVFDGTIDAGNEYPNVGVVFTERTNPRNDVTGGGPAFLVDGDHCNGVLIAEQLVLTIAACVSDRWDDFAYVSFAADYDPLYDYGGTDDEGNPLPFLEVDGEPLAPWDEGDDICREPCYRGEVIRASSSFKGNNWLAVLRLDESPTEVEGIEPAPLPALGTLAGLLGEDVTSVGYNDVACESDAASGEPWDCDDVEDFFDTPFENNQIVGRHIHLTERRFDTMEVTNVTKDLLDVEAVLNCDDLGGGSFDDTGTLVAMNHAQSCDETVVRRLDTNHARNFLCTKEFPELSGSALCGGAAAKSVPADDGEQSADRQQKGKSEGKHKGKKGNQDRGKGKRGR